MAATTCTTTRSSRSTTASATAEPGWEAIVDRWEVDALLFPPHEAITRGPAAAAGWCEAFRDENEVVFLRTCD